MAYIKPLTDEEERKKAAGQQTQEQVGSQIIGAQGGDSSVPNMPSPQQSGQSGFTDISAYLEANKPQTEELAGKFAGQFATQADKTRGLATEAGTQFKTKVGEGTTTLDQNLLDEATKNSAEFIKDQAKVDKLTTMRDASYKGPERIEDIAPYAEARSAVTEAERMQKLPETAIGRRELITGAQKNPTRGLVTLDEALLGQSPTAIAKLKEGAGRFAGLSDYLAQQGIEGQKAVEEGKKTTSAASTGVKTGLSTASQSVQDDIDRRVGEARGKAGERLTSAQEALKNLGTKPLTEQQLSDLGLTQDQYRNMLFPIQTLSKYSATNGVMTPEMSKVQQDIFNAVNPETIDYAKYFSQSGLPEVGITKENVANQDEYAKYMALSGLAGNQPSYLTDATKGQAGTANLDLSNFDFGAAQTAGASSAKNADKQYLQWLNLNNNRYGSWGSDTPTSELKDINDFHIDSQYSNYKGTTQEKDYIGSLGTEALRRYGLTYDPTLERMKSEGFTIPKKAEESIDYGNQFGTIPGTAVPPGTPWTPINPGKTATNPPPEIYSSPKKSFDPIADITQKPIDAVKNIIKEPTRIVTAPVKSVSKAIKSLCFDGATRVSMADGTLKHIKDIQLGDRVTSGGEVYSTRRSIVNDNDKFSYHGIIVTGHHAVNDNGVWRRIKDCEASIPVIVDGDVYSIGTTAHRMIINGIEFADEYETNNYEEISIDESLAELNKQGEPKK